MKAYLLSVQEKLDDRLQQINASLPAKDFTAEAVNILTQLIAEAKQFILQYTFDSAEEEIDTFKNRIPDLFSALIYYRKLYHLHAHAAVMNESVHKKQLRRELKKITYFFESNQELLQYHARSLSDRDRILFTRKSSGEPFNTADYIFLIDNRFCPLASYQLAKMKAYLRLEKQIQIWLQDIHQMVRKPGVTKDMQWTASKSAATELVYSLFASGVFNSGRAKLKEIVSVFESSFQLNLDGYQRSYQDLKMRKKSRTSFLSDLRSKLENKMDEEE